MKTIGICDGSCLKNPGLGGWACAVIGERQIYVKYGSDSNSTNNIMELTAILELLKLGQTTTIYTDSSYVVDGINSWRFSWAKNGWQTVGKKPIANLTLWQAIHNAENLPNNTIKWIKGHTKLSSEIDPQKKFLIIVQDLVDVIAKKAAMEQNSGEKFYNIKELLNSTKDWQN